MRLDFSNIEQISTFVWAIALGAVLCILYDILRFLVSSYKNSSVIVFIADLFFFVVAGVLTFCFLMLFSKGTIRFYVFLGEMVGFVVLRVSLSRFVRGLLKLISRLISKLFMLMKKPIICLARLIIKAYKKIVQHFNKIMRDFFNWIKGLSEKIKFPKTKKSRKTKFK